MHSVRLEPTGLVLIGTRTTYQYRTTAARRRKIGTLFEMREAYFYLLNRCFCLQIIMRLVRINFFNHPR